MSLDSIRAKLAGPIPRSVDWEKEPLIVGTFVDLVSIQSRFGSGWAMVIEVTHEQHDDQCGYDTPDGCTIPPVERRSFVLGTALMSQFKRLRPERGKPVGVRSLGERKSQSGARYHDFRVEVDRERDHGWDDIETSYDEEG